LDWYRLRQGTVPKKKRIPYLPGHWLPILRLCRKKIADSLDTPLWCDKVKSLAATRVPRIRPEYRTRPMTLREAARLMGYGQSKDASERLRAAIKAGAVPCETLTRQQHIFSKKAFPSEAQGKLA
jgi:hypothetical protein